MKKKLKIFILGTFLLVFAPFAVSAATLVVPDEVNVSDTAQYLAEAEQDFAGSAFATSDFNGDGYEDTLISAYTQNSTVGAVYLIAGGPDRPAGEVNLADADAIYTGEALGDQLGYSVAAGDINGDGYDDIIIGAIGEDAELLTQGIYRGAVYVMYGGATLPPSQSVANADIKFVAESLDRAGSAVAAGDINRDGIDDLLIGAEAVDLECLIVNVGSVYIVYGATAGLPSGVTNLDTADVEISGSIQSSNFGSSLAVADKNADGYEDIVIAAENWGTDADDDFQIDTDMNDMGAVYVINGKSGMNARQYITRHSALDFEPCSNPINNPTYTNNVSYQIYTGESQGDLTGNSVATGDVNGDGYQDFIVGSLGHDYNAVTSSGIVYIIYGGELVVSYGSLANAATKYYSEDSAALGTQVASDDVNDDGIDDILMGAPTDNTAGTGTGGAWLVLGEEERSGDAAINVADVGVVHYLGEAPDLVASLTGNAVALSDVDGDGNSDVWLGAPSHSATASLSGRAFLSFPYADNAEIESATADNGNITMNYVGGRSVTITPFNGKKNFRFALSTNNMRLAVTNGKQIKIYKNAKKVTQKKAINYKPAKKSKYRFKLIGFYNNYDNIILITAKKKEGKVVVYRLVNNELKKKKTKTISINNHKKLKIKTKKSKKKIITTFGKGDNKVKNTWKLTKKGKLKLLK